MIAEHTLGRGLSTARRSVRSVASVLALFLVTVVLSGCVSLDVRLTIRTDGTIDGTVLLAFDRKALSATGQGEQEFLAQMTDENPLGEAARSGAVSVQPYRTTRLVGARYVYRDLPVSEFSRPDSMWKLRHASGRYVVSGKVDLSSTGDERVNFGSLGSSARATFQITFPGRVISANGEVEGSTVTWRPEFGKTTALSATAEDGRGWGRTVGWVTALGGVVIVGTAVVWWGLRPRGPRPRPREGPHGPPDGV